MFISKLYLWLLTYRFLNGWMNDSMGSHWKFMSMNKFEKKNHDLVTRNCRKSVKLKLFVSYEIWRVQLVLLFPNHFRSRFSAHVSSWKKSAIFFPWISNFGLNLFWFPFFLIAYVYSVSTICCWTRCERITSTTCSFIWTPSFRGTPASCSSGCSSPSKFFAPICFL